MNTLSVGHLAAQALPALSPWIIPAIAVAAKGSLGRARWTLPCARPDKCAGDQEHAKAERRAPARTVLWRRFAQDGR
jgi:hypothetical protein